MFKYTKTIFLLACTLSLSACLKVEDKGDNKVADAITEQNKILQQQNSQASQTKTTVTLTGVINNASTDTPAVNATVTLSLGSTAGTSVEVSNGVFEFSGLPPDSNFSLVVHSTTGAFMDRVVFSRTRDTSFDGVVYQLLEPTAVSAGVERSFSLLDAKTSAPITTLVLKANSNLGSGPNFQKYLHTSTYDATTQKHKITLPERLDLFISAELDVNNDGKVDYKPESQNFGNNVELFIQSTEISNPNPIYLIDLNQRATIKLSLLDADLKPLLGAKPSAADTLNGSINATFNATTNQYVFEAVIGNELNIFIPEFTADKITYANSSMQIRRAPDIGRASYSVTTSSNNNNIPFSFGKDDAQIFEVAIKPNITNFSSNISVNLQSTAANVVTDGFKVFYSSPIALNEKSVTLTRKNILKVTKGDASSSDLVLAGTTHIEAIEEPVETNSQLTLNDSLLSITPKVALVEGDTYRYSIGAIKDRKLNIDVDLSNDLLEFSVQSSAAFAIGDIKLDNNNYTVNGMLIKATNTANEPPTQQNFFQSVSLFLPTSIENLKTLTLRKEKAVKDGVASNDIQILNIVTDGKVNSNFRKTHTVINPAE